MVSTDTKHRRPLSTLEPPGPTLVHCNSACLPVSLARLRLPAMRGLLACFIFGALCTSSCGGGERGEIEVRFPMDDNHVIEIFE